jgi:hypothetical protein
MSSSEQKPAGFTLTGQRGSDAASDAGPEGGSTLPPVDFTTFVLSLGTSALMHFGESDPQTGTGPGKVDLPLAKHTIDLLSMLQAKTRGNLTGQEAQLLESLLFDLRLRYVSAAKP